MHLITLRGFVTNPYDHIMLQKATDDIKRLRYLALVDGVIFEADWVDLEVPIGWKKGNKEGVNNEFFLEKSFKFRENSLTFCAQLKVKFITILIALLSI